MNIGGVAGLIPTFAVILGFVATGTFGDLIDKTILSLVGSQAQDFNNPIPPIFGAHPVDDGRFTFLYSPPPVFNDLLHGTTTLGLASRRLGGKPLLEWVVRRVTESLLLDRVIVVVDPAMEDAVRALTPPDISIFVSRQPDMLGRFAAAAREYDAHQLVRIGVDNPFD